MMNQLALVTYLVRDYDEGIEFFTEKLHFDLIEDTAQGYKRWVVVRPRGGSGAGLLLAKAAAPEQESAIGNQTGGRVFLFLHTDDFHRDYNHMRAHGVQFMEEPRDEEYGIVAVFKDLYGNTWDLLQPK